MVIFNSYVKLPEGTTFYGEIQTIEILILLEFNHVDCPIK